MDTGSVVSLFLAWRSSYKDAVEVVEGEYAGRRGSVIALLTWEPELVYLIEFGDGGGDVEIAERKLTAVE